MKTRFFCFFSVLLFSSLIVVPSFTSAQSIVGKWAYADATHTVEFTADGYCRLYVVNDDSYYGVYQLTDEALTIVFLGSDEAIVYPLSELKGGKLTLLDPESYEPLVYSYKGKHEISEYEIEAIASMLDAATDAVAEEVQESTNSENWASNTPAQLSLAQISGIWNMENGDEQLLLNGAQYFEAKSEGGHAWYGIWAVEGNQLQFGFAETGVLSSFDIVEVETGDKLVLSNLNASGEVQMLTYRYAGSAPGYPQHHIDTVLAEFRAANSRRNSESYLQTSQLQQSLHNTTMSIINNYPTGGSGHVIIRDQYGNIIGRN